MEVIPITVFHYMQISVAPEFGSDVGHTFKCTEFDFAWISTKRSTWKETRFLNNCFNRISLLSL